MSMTKTDKQALRRLAKKATKQQWHAFTAPGTHAVHTAGDARCGDIIKWPGFDDQPNAENNAKFIAAANPVTVLALLDELEAADALNKHLELAIRKAEGCSEKLRAGVEAAEKRIANLFSALKLIESEVSERFDMDDSKTNPGIKHAVEQAQSALSAGIALDTGE